MLNKKFYIFSLSCPSGHYETEKLRGLFQGAGWEILKENNNPEYPFDKKCVRQADLVIYNTCAFTEQAADDCLRFIGQMQLLMKKGAELIICGCLPKTNPERLEKVFNGFSFSWGELDRLISYLGMLSNSNKIKKESLSTKEWNVRISTGCVNNCAYCADKKAIGYVKSRPVEEIILEIKDGLDRGYADISLSAHDSGAYGIDKGLTLPLLLREILKVKKEFKIGIDCLNPQHLCSFADELIEIYKDDRVLKYIHPSLQSGSDRIIKLMNRQYFSKDYISCLMKFQKKIPQMEFGTDIIVGFPSETGADFKATLRVIAYIPFKTINIFTYSSRPNTPAASLPDQIAEDVKQERKQQAFKLWKKIRLSLPA